MKYVMIIRHGQTASPAGIKGRQEYDLCNEGKQTMNLVATLIDYMNVEKSLIVTGPLRRALESGKILNTTNLPMEIMDEFDEIDVGNLVGYTGEVDLDEYDAKVQENHAESSAHAVSRAMKGLLKIKQKHGQTTVVVSHSFLMTLLYLELKKAEHMPMMVPLNHGFGYVIDLDTMTIVQAFPDLDE
ncbi:histidine phosphatase family protein [Allobaculum stercoricanis]|uniref:histidine phosphatase family protein n=1 Tax=Allobaculum stercoricanis TaxID=174709 RepID=UPI00248DE9C8|nr:histidine phosphatase family protein [Allobaculum stercoricanis]